LFLRPSRPSSITFAIDAGGAIRSPKAWCITLATLAPTSMPTSSSSAMGPTGNPNADHRAIHVLDRDSLLDQPRGLVHVGHQRARGVEAGAVLHHDHVLAHPAPERHGGGDRGRLRLPARHHLEQRHLVHRREEVHPEHAPGPARALHDVADRQRRRVGRVDRVVGHHRFGLGQHLLLEREVLEDRLDQKLAAAKAAHRRGRRDALHAPLELQRRQAAALLALVQDLAHRSEPARERLAGRVLEPYRDARLVRGDRGDPGPIRPAPMTPSLRLPWAASRMARLRPS
jgi:hypothetical protein